jgi:hypothetical protein
MIDRAKIVIQAPGRLYFFTWWFLSLYCFCYWAIARTCTVFMYVNKWNGGTRLSKNTSTIASNLLLHAYETVVYSSHFPYPTYFLPHKHLFERSVKRRQILPPAVPWPWHPPSNLHTFAQPLDREKRLQYLIVTRSQLR